MKSHPATPKKNFIYYRISHCSQLLIAFPFNVFLRSKLYHPIDLHLKHMTWNSITDSRVPNFKNFTNHLMDKHYDSMKLWKIGGPNNAKYKCPHLHVKKPF